MKNMNRKTVQKQIAILIPAHNEEMVLAKTLDCALKVIKKQDLYIVNDGSKDKTAGIAKSYTKNVLNLKQASGKATALNSAIAYFKLISKYKYIFPMDADTKITPDFITKALDKFKKDPTGELVCVIGKVTGESNNWLTSYRLWEYETYQLVHKAAQEKEQAIIVCPGCATVYKSAVFAKIQFSKDTIVEDMDLTFQIHREKIGKIAFASGAKVITQDPYTLQDYFKQIRRWYKGYWQCLKKYSVPWGKQTLDFELLLSTVEGLAGGLMAVLFLTGFFFIIKRQPLFFVAPFLLDFFLFFFPTVFVTVFIHSNLKIIKYLPFFYFLRTLNSLVFLYSFFESALAIDNVKWEQLSRYRLEKGKICITP